MPLARRDRSRPVTELVARLTAPADRAERLTHLELLPPRAATPAAWPQWVPDRVREAFGSRGIDTPWQHQVVAAEHAHAGRHVVLSTGTASGKSLAFQLPALTSVHEGRGTRGERGATVLYVAPTKALAQDQWAGLRELGLDTRITSHDGDSSRELRDWAREHGEYVLTNPDMLHHSMLPGHERWARFFATLDYVVVDEAHHYRGVFGAHVAQVLRRLRRVAARWGARPTFVLASATMAEPAGTAARLTGLPMVAVTEDTSPRGTLALGFWEPPFTRFTGENGAPLRRSAGAETADLLADLVVDGVRTLAFVRSRRGTEQVARATADALAEVDDSLPGRVAAYRGGYLPEERRDLEQRLRRGDLLGLAATSALELGIDVSGLDAVVMAGYPGTRSGLWQQLGRAGRGAEDALGLLVARDDPLDTYLVHHPEALVGQPVEATVFDTDNRFVLGPHLCAAAQELPLTEADLPLFGATAPDVLADLVGAGLLRRRTRGWFWTDPGTRAADLADIRSTGGAPVQLLEADTGRVVGTVDASRSHATAHAGAVYLHRGETWVVQELDLVESVAVMVRADPDHSTSARELTSISVVAERRHVDWGGCRLAFGDVEVTHQVVSYLKRRPTGEVIGEEPLDLPVRTLRTTAVWWSVPAEALAESGLAAADLPGAAHAAEHCSIGLLPLFATCDRWDIGGVSTALHPDTGRLTVFVHDGHPGGAGFAERGFDEASAWLLATRDAIRDCGCPEGCPSCVQSPKCGNQNHPLDKEGAVVLLDLLLSHRPPTGRDRPAPAR